MYKVNEVFYSLQGEGVRAGCPSVFVRMTGCNRKCDGKLEDQAYLPVCDTEFMSGRELTLPELVGSIRDAANGCDWIVMTGGEPLLQVDKDLIVALKRERFFIAIETNGTLPVPEGFDWVCVSPKVAEHSIKQTEADEVKYVRCHGQGIPKTVVKANHYVISPAYVGGMLSRDNLDWCIKLCLDNPPWRLSVQQHPLWKVR